MYGNQMNQAAVPFFMGYKLHERKGESFLGGLQVFQVDYEPFYQSQTGSEPELDEAVYKKIMEMKGPGNPSSEEHWPFEIQKAISRIAVKTRRGAGNCIWKSKDTKFPFSYREWLRIENRPFIPDGIVVIGYFGNNRTMYDCGICAQNGSLYLNKFALNDGSDYFEVVYLND